MPDVSFPNLYNTDHIGESALDDAMPWDVIQAASFDAYGQISSLLPELNTRHKDRVEDNIEFDYFRANRPKGRGKCLTHTYLAQRGNEKD